MKKITKKSIQFLFKPREANAHKGNYGHALIIAGSMGCMGAAVIAAKACLRAGVGLLTLNIPADERFILQTTIPEAMLLRRENIACDFKRFSAIGIGPGLGIDAIAVELLSNILSQINQPLILDADALNNISANTHLMNSIPPQTVLTPHPKEFDRLFGMHKNDEDRIQTALQKAKELNLVIVLKSHRTMITNGSETFQNTTGNAGLAKGGSGDALTGMITAFLAQGYQPIIAAQIGVYLHGLAADITLQKQSMESMLITDVIENLGQAFKQIQS